MDHVAECCQALGRRYVAAPLLTEAMLLAALRHAIELGAPLRLTGFPCGEEAVPVILRRWQQRGWIKGQRVTNAGRAAAARGTSPWA